MLNRRIVLLAALGAIVAASASAAQLYASGEQASQLCRESNEWCVGFVTGALDGWAAMESYFPGEKFCVPEGLTTGEITALFTQALGERTDLAETPGAYVLYETLIESYPCP